MEVIPHFESATSSSNFLAKSHGSTSAQPLRKLDISETVAIRDYQAKFSLRNLLEDLARHSAAVP